MGIAIGEKCKTINYLSDLIDKKEAQISRLTNEVQQARDKIKGLETPDLAIKLFRVDEDHHVPGSTLWSSNDTHRIEVYYFPDTDRVYAKRIFSGEPLFPNTVDLTSHYLVEEIVHELPYGERFMDGKRYQRIINPAVEDVRSRITNILKKNKFRNARDWQMVGILLQATYYNM